MVMMNTELSHRWRYGVVCVALTGLGVLIWIAVNTYTGDVGTPIPTRVVDMDGHTVFTGADIIAGQQVFQKHALMENGTIWGHGAYLGPDFSAAYLHALALEAGETQARQVHGLPLANLHGAQRDAVEGAIQRLLQENRYDPRTQILVFSEPEAASYRRQIGEWADYFVHPEGC